MNSVHVWGVFVCITLVLFTCEFFGNDYGSGWACIVIFDFENVEFIWNVIDSLFEYLEVSEYNVIVHDVYIKKCHY